MFRDAYREPLDHWNNLQSYTEPDFRILSDYMQDTATGLGINIQVHGAIMEQILGSPHYTDSQFGKYKVPVFPSHVYNPLDLAVWHADGASFLLYAGYTGFPVNDLHSVFLLTLLPPLGQDPLKYLGDLTGPILQSLDCKLCNAIRLWFYLGPTDPISNTLGDLVPQALISLQTQLQVNFLFLIFINLIEHIIQTQDLISELVVDNTIFWQTKAFQQMCQGFHQVFDAFSTDLTIPKAFMTIPCGPLNVIAYLYDCKPCTPTEIFDYIDFGTPPALLLFPSLCHNFWMELFAFLLEDIEHSKALLYTMSGSKNLPRQANLILQFEFKVLDSAGSIFAHACIRRAEISWDAVMNNILAGRHKALIPTAWLEAILTGVAGYSML
ncbi:uncharacterized protein EV420DRAFT_1636386 [Desarmillaria tabescens]|uniref:Uncharacterized protein n=1 Tax=Armillaria tabescens TaxID=1929756 RepID=A0AA39NKK6_ARMTA|nr:uncharacterized protein EV420DRAFT_1636386 [Desarmillaria tabescens]KAK0467356.1 hypothetical protein EV420DRAFT_1636386 [Desarmillaria tabescens]